MAKLLDGAKRLVKAKTMKRSKETAVICITDAHIGKETSTFDLKIAKKRIKYFGATLRRIHELMSPSCDFDKAVVLFLGDINDGTQIYKTQTHHQAESDVNAQAVMASEGMFLPLLRDIAELFGKVEVHGIAGNHGVSSRFTHEAANWDLVFYHYLRMLTKNDKRFDVRVHDDFIHVARVRKHGILLYHGHQIKSYQQIPWYGIVQRALRWTAARNLPEWDVMTMGHFHNFGLQEINRFVVLMNGTLVTDDEWALQTIGYESSNKWWVFGVSDKRPLTWSFGVNLIK